MSVSISPTSNINGSIRVPGNKRFSEMVTVAPQYVSTVVSPMSTKLRLASARCAEGQEGGQI